MEFYTQALSNVLTFWPLTAMIGATLLGVFIGALPGLNPVMAIALLLPLTYSMDPLVALAMVAGIYNGSMYGGAIPAILLRIPGTPASIATTFDGFPMADKGEAAKALKIACWSSAVGGRRHCQCYCVDDCWPTSRPGNALFWSRRVFLDRYFWDGFGGCNGWIRPDQRYHGCGSGVAHRHYRY